MISLPLRTALVMIAASLLAATPASAASADQNWGQWRGPLASGVAPGANPPATWSETNNVKWKVEIPGNGSATPVIWDNLVFLQTAITTGRKPAGATESAATPAPAATNNAGPARRGGPNTEKPTEIYQFALLCLDRQDGHTLWRKVAREEVPHEGYFVGQGSLASQSPITDGEHVYGCFGSRGYYCYDLKGNLLWTNDLGRMKVKMSFGEGSSAALSGNTLVVQWDHEGDSFIVALDKRTGHELWRSARDEKTSWATPLIVSVDGKSQVITDASKKIRSYDLATGKLVWECGGLSQNVIPSPVYGNGLVYCLSGFQGFSLLAIRPGRTGDVTGTDAIAWHLDANTPYVPSPVLYGNRLYFLKSNNGILSCFNATTGASLFGPERIEAIPDVYASPVGAGGRVYLPGRNGVTVVIRDADKLEILATNKLDEAFDASPAAVGNELFLRGQSHLDCVAGK